MLLFLEHALLYVSLKIASRVHLLLCKLTTQASTAIMWMLLLLAGLIQCMNAVVPGNETVEILLIYTDVSNATAGKPSAALSYPSTLIVCLFIMLFLSAVINLYIILRYLALKRCRRIDSPV